MSSPSSAAGRAVRADSPLFTVALFAVVLAAVFTVAFWIGRTVGPAPASPVHGTPGHPPASHASGALR